MPGWHCRYPKPVNQRILSLENCFTSAAIPRLSGARRDADWIAKCLQREGTALLPVWRGMNLVQTGSAPGAAMIPAQDGSALVATATCIVFLGECRGRLLLALGLPPDLDPQALQPRGRFQDLKRAAPLLSRDAAALLAYARAMVNWHEHSRYCGSCGHPTASVDAGHARRCTNPECGQQSFPRTDPAVIAVVTAGEKCLLGRQGAWPEGFYSTLAGFVEPGESLEEAVVREVQEEAGVRVTEVSYHSSQPWPFPGSLMVGFVARAEETPPVVDRHELEDACWLTRGQLAHDLSAGRLRLPPPVSIAFRLIEDWFDDRSSTRLRAIIKSLKTGEC